MTKEIDVIPANAGIQDFLDPDFRRGDVFILRQTLSTVFYMFGRTFWRGLGGTGVSPVDWTSDSESHDRQDACPTEALVIRDRTYEKVY